MLNEIVSNLRNVHMCNDTIVIYGYGRQGKSYLPQLQATCKVKYIIDNSMEEGKSKEIDDAIMMCYSDYEKIKDGELIVITASGKSRMSIVDGLLKAGLREYVDFMDADSYIALKGWMDDGSVRLGRVAIPVTEVCTLKCEKCMVSVPYNEHPQHYSYELLCRSIDKLFAVVDYVGCLQIFGGEPFSNRDFPDYIHYVEKEYGNRIGIFQIISNGTVKPSDTLINALQSYANIDMRFSDYTDAVSYKEKFENVLAVLEKNDIKYRIEKFDWLDMGSRDEGICIASTIEEIHKHMTDCNGRCQTYYDGKYYFCSRQWASERVYGEQLEAGDYLEIENSKEELLAFHIGMMGKGYCSYCNKCRGFDHGIPIKAGVQLD